MPFVNHIKPILLLLFVSIHLFLTAQTSNIQYVFKNHKDGYNMFRIPTIIKTSSGKLLAFCEGRKSLFDHGSIDLVMKTSKDNGSSWTPLKVVWTNRPNTCGNPSPVLDTISGDIIIVATLTNDKVFVLRSKDEGATWEKPIDVTSSVKESNWKWYATGPVHTIQLEQKEYKNRIVVPCNHTVIGINKHISHVIYSDDCGFTWHLGGSVSGENTDECTVAELTNGSLLLNMRNHDRTLPNRKISISTDGGQSWTSTEFDTTLIEPMCQGALLNYSYMPNTLLFSNPMHKKSRRNLTLSISYDQGKTWKKHISLFAKKSAYSDIVVLGNGDVLCLFETGRFLPYSGIKSIIIPQKMIVN